jgi:hypothetical protein
MSMPTADEIRSRANIFGRQIEGTPFFRLTLAAPDGEETDLGTMTVTAKQMLALARSPSDHATILATSERMP